MNQKKTGIVFSYLIMIFNIAVGLLYTPFMLQKIGDSQYGIYSLSISLSSFISLLDLGFGQTLVRYISKARALDNKEEEARLNGFFLMLYSIIAVVAIIVGAFILWIYPVISNKSMNGDEILLFRIVFSILLINTVFSFPMCIFSSTINAYENFVFLKAVNLLMIIIRYICCILLLAFGYQLAAITLVTALTSVLTQIIYAIYCKSRLNIKFSFKNYNKELIDEIFWFSFFIFLNLIIDFLYSNTDKLILGAIHGTFAVTVYSFGIYFQNYFMELSTAMSGVFLPHIVYLYERKKDMKEISDLFLRVGRLQMAILTLALGGYIALGKEFISLWVGDDYRDAYYIGLIIMLPALIPLTQNIGISILRAMNLHKYRSYMYLIIAILNVGISIPLGNEFGGIGTAVGTCIACIAGQIFFMNWFYSKKIGIDIKMYWHNLIKFATICIPGIICIFFFKHFIPVDKWILFIVYGVIFILAYFTLYWFLISNLYEKSLINSLLCKFFRKRKKL